MRISPKPVLSFANRAERGRRADGAIQKLIPEVLR
jgi:hypothetical protein